VRAAESPSGQGYTPLEGQELTGRVTATFLRSALVYDGARVAGAALGRYVARPKSLPSAAS
jgi:allantoinase